MRRSNRLIIWFASSVLVAAISACASTQTKQTLKLTSDGRYVFPTIERSFRNTLVDRTVFFSGGGHGTQVEYFANDGRAYLWYRGNRASVPSNWKTASPSNGDIPGPPIPITQGDVAICFQYPSRSYNPATKTFGGEWQCRSSFLFAENIVAILEGDLFNLSSGRLPAVMPKDRALTVDQVLSLSPTNETFEYVYKR